ncbi:MAG: NTP transferase domain-containing protein [Clostridia bacterium]|nr:NTP transferase domain-containing protein [Clostridia bacterium]
MNRRDKDVLLLLSECEYTSQRDLADTCGCSLGAVNGALKNLVAEAYADEQMRPTEKSRALLAVCAPRRAVLLAAGMDRAACPRALLTVGGEPLIERLILQLQEVGVRDICVVVGFQKERFEYLIDRFGVELVVNPQYMQRNNLHSLALVADRLDNAYVIPCDLWFRENPFRYHELYSWYMVAENITVESSVRINRKQELAMVPPLSGGNAMVGVSYLLPEEAAIVRQRLLGMDVERRYEGAFWEETLYEGNKLLVGARLIASDQMLEVNSPEELFSRCARMDIAAVLAQQMGASPQEITALTLLKKGVINQSYSFSCRGERYVACFRERDIPVAPDLMEEAVTYAALAAEGLADTVVALDPQKGVKISRYIVHDHLCDPHNAKDVGACMQRLRYIHGRGLTTPHRFDLFEKLQEFEDRWEGVPSAYADYATTKAQVLSLKEYIDRCPKGWTLTHIDPVPDNFLMPAGEDAAAVRLIDWEYAAMQDPHVDIAMFCLSAMYDHAQVDRVIDAYFPEGCDDATRLKIYCYIAVGGLLWSNWCECLQKSGIEFGDYSLRQYRYTKNYYRLARQGLDRIKEKVECQS